VIFVIASPDYQGSPEALEALIKDHVADRMGKPFRPSRVYIMKDLPKTRSQKVMRRLIRNIFMQETLGDLSALNNPSAMEELQQVLKNSAP
jgi:acetyl-CoA synthetase